MERVTRLELASTTLRMAFAILREPGNLRLYKRWRQRVPFCSPFPSATREGSLLFGAGDEARTRYLHLGKVALYQMSYTRDNVGIIPCRASSVKG